MTSGLVLLRSVLGQVGLSTIYADVPLRNCSLTHLVILEVS